MNIQIKPVSYNEKQILSEMINLYLDDLSKHANEHFPKPYKHLDVFFSESSRRPLFIELDGKIVGFALVNLIDPLSNGTKQAISEFFVLHEYRRKGIGEKAAQQIFDLFPGIWVIREIKGNPAIEFWKKVINKYTEGNYIEYEQNDAIRKRNVQEFTNLRKLT